MNHSSEPLADTVSATVARLSISRSAFYRELKAGRLTALKAGGRTIVARSEQERWLASLSATSTTSREAA